MGHPPGSDAAFDLNRVNQHHKADLRVEGAHLGAIAAKIGLNACAAESAVLGLRREELCPFKFVGG